MAKEWASTIVMLLLFGATVGPAAAQEIDGGAPWTMRAGTGTEVTIPAEEGDIRTENGGAALDEHRTDAAESGAERDDESLIDVDDAALDSGERDTIEGE